MKKNTSLIISIFFYSVIFADGILVKSSNENTLNVSAKVQTDIHFFNKKFSGGHTYKGFSVPGTGQMAPGKPEVPGFARWILIPNGTTASISTSQGTPVVYKNINLAPVQQDSYASFGAPLPPICKNEKIYNSDTDFPGVFAEIEPVKYKRGQSCTILWIYPNQYNPVQKTLKVYPDLNVIVTFTGNIEPIPANLKSAHLIKSLKSMAINADAVLNAEENAGNGLKETEIVKSDGCELLIITHPNFEGAATKLASWKIRRGIYTQVVTTNVTGSTSAEIETYIDNAYSTWSPAPEYLLFFGDAEFVPTCYRTYHPSGGNQDTIGTDFYYADFDEAADYIAEFGYGRLSVDSVNQANTIVERIISYERTPTTNPDFYSNILNIAMFQDGEGPGIDSIADRRFCKTSEDIRNYLMGEGYSSHREYMAYNALPTQQIIYPTWWNDSVSQDKNCVFENDISGGEIPLSLQRPFFSWDGDSAGISDAINAGKFFTIYSGHGWKSGWGDFQFEKDAVDALSNGGERPFIWSIACKTGWFDNETDGAPCNTPPDRECFAEHWLRHPTGGSCGIVAATRQSHSRYNDRLAWGMMDAIWPGFLTWAQDPYGGPDPVYRMGDVLNYGKEYMFIKCENIGTVRDETVEYYHWFGDPTTEMWTAVPNELTSAEVLSTVEIGTTSIDVQVYPATDEMLVAICTENGDGIFGTAYTDASGFATVPLNHEITMEGAVYITITKHNYKPYEFGVGPATWEGDVSLLWMDPRNWDINRIPDNSTDAIIPAGTSSEAWITITNAECRNITIESGALLRINETELTVHEDMNIHGELEMTQNTAKLYVYNDITWEYMSSANIIADNAEIWIKGIWEFVPGSHVHLDNGYVEFYGNTSGAITTNAIDSWFNHIISRKTGGASLYHSASSTQHLKIYGDLYNFTDSKIQSVSSQNIILKGSLMNQVGASFQIGIGTFVLDGTMQNITLNSTDYINNLTITSSGNINMNSDMALHGDLLISSGALITNDYDIRIEGNWTNAIGEAGFDEGEGRVIIWGGNYPQYCFSNETFYELELNKMWGGTFCIDGYDILCEAYDWTSGEIEVISGTFTANTLIDDGIFGNLYVHSDGTINLSNYSGWIDLNCDLTFTDGGTINIYGGTSDSYWTYGGDVHVSMNAGSLNFHDRGIFLFNSGNSLTTNITGGTIKTAGGFYGNLTGFNPTGGIIECKTSTDGVIELATGNNFHDLHINKTTKSGNTNSNLVTIPRKNNAKLNESKSSTISLISDVDINGWLLIENGILNTAGYNIYIAGDWDNTVGDAGFLETTASVIFDGATDQYCYGEKFYTLEIDKSWGQLTFPDGTSSNCQYLDWTQGGYQVDGDFTALDLIDNGLYGYIQVYNGNLTLHQGNTTGEFVDLNGELTIYGGSMIVHGGTDDSWWTYGGDASITMTGGSLEFADVGIQIYHNPAFSFTENITGGTISTPLDFIVSRENFSPEGGTVHLVGSNDADLDMVPGSGLCNLVINKSSKSGSAGQYPKQPRFNVSGNTSKSNTVTALANLDINGAFTILDGYFVPPPVMNVAGDWDNQVNDKAFFEGTGMVYLDGPMSSAAILKSETFFDLFILKTSDEPDALMINSDQSVTVLNDLSIQNGSLYMLINSMLDVDNDITIENEAGLFSNAGSVYIGGDWINYNTILDANSGFHCGNSAVAFDGPEHQYFASNMTIERFYDLVIDKAGASGDDIFEPLGNIRVIHELDIVDGFWFDSPAGNVHEFNGDVDVAVNCKWIDDIGTILFMGTTASSFSFYGGGNFENIGINMSDPGVHVLFDGQLEFNYLNINAGNLQMTKNNYINHSGIFIDDDGRLDLDAGAYLASVPGAVITVYTGGEIAFNGNPGDNCVVTTNGGTGFYHFNIEGEIAAEYTLFSNMSADGINVMPGASVDPIHVFNHCEFSFGETGGTYLTVNSNQNLICDEATFFSNSWGGNSNVRKTADVGEITFINYSGDFAGEDYDDDPFNRIQWGNNSREIELTLFLEGPFNGTGMFTNLNPAHIPLAQPYNSTPWNYIGTESVTSIPANVVDWILLELRDATDAALATSATVIHRQAVFVLSDGTVVATDGSSNPEFTEPVANNLYVVIYHRNHLSIMSANALTQTGGVYSYDFTTGSSQVYGGANGHKEVGTGIWGMIGGDGNADGQVNNGDKNDVWTPQAGTAGYKAGDYNLDTDVNNGDKNDILLPNAGTGGQVPDFSFNGYKSQVPE